MKNPMIYRCYGVYIKCPKCKQKVKTASFDYLFNARERRKSLIETFGQNNVIIKKEVKKIYCPVWKV